MQSRHPGRAFALTLASLCAGTACGLSVEDSTTTFATGMSAGEEGTEGGEHGPNDPDDPDDPDPGTTGEGSDATGDDTSPTGIDDDGSDTTGDASGPDPDPGVSSCSAFPDAEGLFAFVNQARADYGGEGIYLPHGRYKGIPWQGQGHESWTFSTTMTWDDGLAAEARAAAESLALGSNPTGTKVNGQASIHNPMWIANINTADWRITVTEDLDDWQPDPNNPFSSDVAFALDKSNGSARQGLHYHDFGGDGPAITRLGVGGALGEGPTGECQVWWVLQFGT